ncbi:MAG: hypothetical protein HY756_10195 [Nitrospirae bacterium]|nr:hypothetical protein [Nitrospirota bacterium]
MLFCAYFCWPSVAGSIYRTHFHIRGVKEGDEAVLIGTQGKERITAEDIARKIGTISYEVLTSIGQRVSRIYKNF